MVTLVIILGTHKKALSARGKMSVRYMHLSVILSCTNWAKVRFGIIPCFLEIPPPTPPLAQHFCNLLSLGAKCWIRGGVGGGGLITGACQHYYSLNFVCNGQIVQSVSATLLLECLTIPTCILLTPTVLWMNGLENMGTQYFVDNGKHGAFGKWLLVELCEPQMSWDTLYCDIFPGNAVYPLMLNNGEDTVV